jgi:hypothetical protein
VLGDQRRNGGRIIRKKEYVRHNILSFSVENRPLPDMAKLEPKGKSEELSESTEKKL